MKNDIYSLIKREENRQSNNIELIASENFVSEDVLRVVGSVLTNKYAEGYPTERKTGKQGRYYGGCEFVDAIEQHACDAWAKVFNTDYHVNVQPHCGSNANMAAFMALAQQGDTILSMELSNGGHLTHGSSVNFSGKTYNFVFYGVDQNGYIDMEDVAKKAQEYQPKVILAGASAYPRIIDFEKFAEIAHGVGAYLMVDMAHIAGLIAAGEHPSPFGLADVITTTTHKTLRGPRGGMIFCRPELAAKVDGAVFPGCQGGPLMHVIAGKAMAAEEALMPSYKDYVRNVLKNTKAMADEFVKLGYELVTGGTDNHLFLIDFSNTHPNITGKMVQDALDSFGITLNKNCVPNEKRSLSQTSGVRIGLAAMTTKGWQEADARACAHKIDDIIRNLAANAV